LSPAAVTASFADRLHKIVLPSSERVKVLRYSDQFFLERVRAFDTEAGLMDMLAMRRFDLRRTSAEGAQSEVSGAIE
jgi:hypothetical protein